MNVNERIAKLYNQAIIIEDGGDYVCGELDPEKFAQLIVQECIDIIAPYTVRMSKPGEEYLHPILEIKEHFGVE